MKSFLVLHHDGHEVMGAQLTETLDQAEEEKRKGLEATDGNIEARIFCLGDIVTTFAEAADIKERLAAHQQAMAGHGETMRCVSKDEGAAIVKVIEASRNAVEDSCVIGVLAISQVRAAIEDLDRLRAQ